MPELISGNMRKGVWLSIGLALLPSCSEQSGGQSSGESWPVVEVTASPIDAESIGVRNLISFDVYADGPVLHALFAAATADAGKPLIGYLRSDDGGRHWSSPTEVGPRPDAALESRVGNDVQIASAGEHLLAVWQVSGEIPGMGPLLAMTSGDGGGTWRPGANPTAMDTDQSHPDLAADSQGRFHLVWLDDRDENGYQGIRYAGSSDGGQHWEWAATIDESSCSCCWNRLAIAPGGQLNALYRDMVPRDMALAQSADGGRTWSRTATVGEFNWTFDGCPHNGGGLASADGKTWHGLVWTGADNKVGLYHLQSADGGKTWSAPQAMSPEAPGFHGDIAVVDAEHVVAIWDVLGAEGSSVVVSGTVDNGAHWSSPRTLSAPGASASFPRVLATPAGVLAMWVEQKPGGPKQWRSAILK